MKKSWPWYSCRRNPPCCIFFFLCRENNYSFKYLRIEWYIEWKVGESESTLCRHFFSIHWYIWLKNFIFVWLSIVLLYLSHQILSTITHAYVGTTNCNQSGFRIWRRNRRHEVERRGGFLGGVEEESRKRYDLNILYGIFTEYKMKITKIFPRGLLVVLQEITRSGSRYVLWFLMVCLSNHYK